MQVKNSQNTVAFNATKLYQSYIKLSEEQQKNFKKFLHSPYHNSSKTIIQAWNVFEKFCASSRENLSLLDFYKKLYPARYPSGRIEEQKREQMISTIRKLNSAFWKLLESFLGYEVYKSRLKDQEINIFEGLALLEVEGNYREFRMEYFEDKIQHSSISPNLLFQKFQLYAFHFSNLHTKHNQPRVEDFLKTVSALDEYYLTQRLLYELEYQTLTDRFGQSFEFNSFGKIFQNLNVDFGALNPLAKAAYHLNIATKSPEDQQELEKLIDLLESSETAFERTSLRNLATAAINLEIKKLAENPSLNQKKLLKDYLTFLEKEWICIDGKLEVRHFNNVLNLLLKEHEVWEADKLYKKWKDRLNSSSPEFAQLFHKGTIQLAKGELNAAENSFHQLFQMLSAADDYFFDIKARQILLKIYFLKGSWRDIENRSLSFFNYIKDHPKLAIQHKMAGMNFIKKLSRLYKLKIADTYTYADLDIFKQEIKREPRLSMKSWLLDQVDLLCRK